MLIMTLGSSYRVQDKVGEWLSTRGSSFEPWIVEVADQVYMSDA
jgi:hypothetical protein